MPRRDVIVIGASSGGIEALTEVVSKLPEGLPAAVFVVVHVPARSVSLLPEILNRAGPLAAAHGKDNEERAKAAEDQAAVIRRLLLSDKVAGPLDKTQNTE